MTKILRNLLPLPSALLLGAVLTACLSSCKNDDIVTEEPMQEVESGIRYLSMRLSTTEGEGVDPDAPVYVDGTEFEHAIDFTGDSDNVIIYFDEDYKYKGYSSLEFDVLSSQGEQVDGNANEIAYIGFLRPDYHEAYILPKYGMMVLNAHSIIPALKELNLNTGATIKDVLNLMDCSEGTHIAGRSGHYFTMTSAAYLVKDSNEWKHSIIFEIDREKIFDTRTQAVIQPAAVAYVERMASKFSLTLPGANGGKGMNFIPDEGRAQVIVCRYIDGEPNYSNRVWTCSVEGWGISKYEPNQYFFRNIVGPNTITDTYPYNYGTDINSTGEPFFYGWNRTVDRRCLWAVDPNYYTGVFPVQYRPAVDNTSIEYFGKNGNASLAYLSYNDLCTDLSGIDECESGAVLYSTENTFPDTRVRGLWQHNIAGSELVVGARIHIHNIDESKADYDLFRNRLGIFYPSKADFAQYFISTFNSQLASQSSMSYRFYDWSVPENNSENVTHRVSIPSGDYKLYYGNQPLTAELMASLPKMAIAAMIENGDGKVIPWVEGMYIGRRNKDPNTYEEIGDVIRLSIDANDFKSLIYDWIGAFDHFNRGRMVYTVPILYRASQSKVSANNYRPHVGDFGVVRNTWYNFALHSIDNLGTPVDDLSQPIIPYETSLENSVLMEIKVFDWHEFATDVTLPGVGN